MLVTEMIRRGATWHGDRKAILFGDQAMTFRAVDRLSNRISHVYSGLGLEKGDPLALLLDNGLYSVPCDFGGVKAGLTRTPLNGRLSREEHLQMLSLTGGRTLVYGASQIERAAELQAAMPQLRLYGLGDASLGPDILELAEGASDADPRLDVAPDDVLLRLFTSGTSGTLKAAEHTQATYAAVVHNVLSNLIDPVPGDTMLHAASMIHASGTFVLPYWLRGGAAAILPGFTPASYIEAIER
ncbi:MAG: AMP-binding protein, partial [Sphingomonas sp.]